MEAPIRDERFWLAEAYLPASSEVGVLLAALQHATAELTAAGCEIDCLRAIGVPDDEVCFFLVVASEDELVREAARRAQVPVARVSAVEVAGTKWRNSTMTRHVPPRSVEGARTRPASTQWTSSPPAANA